jgi:hypothetical protein
LQTTKPMKWSPVIKAVGISLLVLVIGSFIFIGMKDISFLAFWKSVIGKLIIIGFSLFGIVAVVFIFKFFTDMSARQDIRLLEAERKMRNMSEGYISIDIPNEQRSIYYDLLRCFEEYANLRGYKISVSIDTSFPNKLAFTSKFCY